MPAKVMLFLRLGKPDGAFLLFVSETFDEFRLGDDGNTQLPCLLVFGAYGGHIVIDKVVGRLAYATRHLAPLALDIGFQFVAVFISRHVAGHNESQSLALLAARLITFLAHAHLPEQLFNHHQVLFVMKPFHNAVTLFRSDARNECERSITSGYYFVTFTAGNVDDFAQRIAPNKRLHTS